MTLAEMVALMVAVELLLADGREVCADRLIREFERRAAEAE